MSRSHWKILAGAASVRLARVVVADDDGIVDVAGPDEELESWGACQKAIDFVTFGAFGAAAVDVGDSAAGDAAGDVAAGADAVVAVRVRDWDMLVERGEKNPDTGLSSTKLYC